MTPFHGFVDEVTHAIQNSGRLENLAIYYFHDVPVEGADTTILQVSLNQTFDEILPNIKPLTTGHLVKNPATGETDSIKTVLEEHATNASVVIISDGGAGRKSLNEFRLLDTIAFLKSLHKYATNYVWLNPLPLRYWVNTTANQIARYIPMLPLTKDGLYHAVNVLRGHPFLIEHPL